MGKKAAHMRWYAVAVGKKQGVFHGWNEGDNAEDQVKGFKGQLYKGFDSEAEAKAWLTPQLAKLEKRDEEQGNVKRPREHTPPPPTSGETMKPETK